jgi:myosin heavy subunit
MSDYQKQLAKALADLQVIKEAHKKAKTAFAFAAIEYEKSSKNLDKASSAEYKARVNVEKACVEYDNCRDAGADVMPDFMRTQEGVRQAVDAEDNNREQAIKTGLEILRLKKEIEKIANPILQEQLAKTKADLWVIEEARRKTGVALINAEAEFRKYSNKLSDASGEKLRTFENVVKACVELEKRRSEIKPIQIDFQQARAYASHCLTVKNKFREQRVKKLFEIRRLKKPIAEEKMKKFDCVQDIFDAGYALPNYDIETKPGAWRNVLFFAKTLSWIYKNHVYNTDRFVPVEKILFKGEMIYVLPHKEEK